MTTARAPLGNILGAARAETDRAMLARAFVETPDFQALINTDDFDFVVGRRGTGKSALFQKTYDHFAANNHYDVRQYVPAEHDVLVFQHVLRSFGDSYRHLRPLSRLAWRAHLLITAAKLIRGHYKIAKTSHVDQLDRYLESHPTIANLDGISQCVEVLRQTTTAESVTELPAKIAAAMGLEKLKTVVGDALEMANHTILLLYDGLDEGWEVNEVSTALLGGLAVAAADFKDAGLRIRPVLFIRDNMFRSLAERDSDFTRHIEGSTLRLHWNDDSLFHLVAMRLRVTLALEELEGDVKVWNRFAARGLENKEGFRKCLNYTLYRPRDILVLLNDAYQNASRVGRTSIIDTDVDDTSRRISQNRLSDLLKEYDVVFPGLGLFVDAFRGKPASFELQNAVHWLEAAAQASDETQPGARDFALFGTARDILFALYSVGFVGLKDPSGCYIFCHDGSSFVPNITAEQQQLAVHPCYWKALDALTDVSPETVVVQVNDEYTEKARHEVLDIRTKRLGTIIEDLSHIEPGMRDRQKFEKWVLQAIKVLFPPELSNIELKPNPTDATMQRDVVATNMARSGFWQRVRDDYGVRQIVFECKNYADLDSDDFRQALGYSSGEYGKFIIIVSRSPHEYLSSVEKGWVRSLYHEHQRLVMVWPADLVARCIRKMRNPNKRDYTDAVLSKRMDTFVRTYLSLTTQKRYTKKKRPVTAPPPVLARGGRR